MSDLDFELLPAGGDTVSAADELSAALEGELPTPDEVVPFGRGWLFDFTANEFTRSGVSPQRVGGEDQLRVWVEKTVRTARNAYPIYSSDYGIDTVDLVGQPFDPELLGQYAQAVEAALLVHDRINAVKKFTFTHDPLDDLLEIGFTVLIDGGALVFEPIPV